MIDVRDPFVTEVVRIIRKSRPRKYGPRAVVLVSRKFYDATCREITRINKEAFGFETKSTDFLFVSGIDTVPVSWLGGYEFEIRKA